MRHSDELLNRGQHRAFSEYCHELRCTPEVTDPRPCHCFFAVLTRFDRIGLSPAGYTPGSFLKVRLSLADVYVPFRLCIRMYPSPDKGSSLSP